MTELQVLTAICLMTAVLTLGCIVVAALSLCALLSEQRTQARINQALLAQRLNAGPIPEPPPAASKKVTPISDRR